MGRLAGKVALISGTARGQGRAAALRFAAEGAVVVGGDLLAEEAAETTRLIEAAGHRAGPSLQLDVTDPESVSAWVSTGVERFGGVDVIYNNAGAVRFAPIDRQAFADWRFTLAAELDSIFLTCKCAWPHLVERSGVILNIASTAGLRGSMTNQRVAHTAAKGGVIALTRQLAAEGAPHGVRANSISPGIIATEGAEETLLHPGHPMHAIARSVPLGRLGTPDDIVNTALFLVSDEAAYITGANFVVDGGWSAVLPGDPQPSEAPA